MTSPIETNNVVERLETAVRALDWKAPVPDDLQSEIRMVFNEALAGGPNMNGDGGPTLSSSHALDCVWATQRIQSLSDRIDVLEDALKSIREHCAVQPSPLAKAIVATCDASLTQGGKNG